MAKINRRANTLGAFGTKNGNALEPVDSSGRSRIPDLIPVGRNAAREPEPFPTSRKPNKTAASSAEKKSKRKAAKTSSGKAAKKTTGAKPQSQAAQRRKLGRGELRRRRRRRRIISLVILLLLVLIGGALSVTVLFKVQDFRVENLDKSMPADTGIYTEEAILGALSVPMEENMFRFSLKQKEKEMAAVLPYLETIRVRRSLPGTIVVQIEPAVESWCLQTSVDWVVLSQGLKVMRTDSDRPEGIPVIRGLEPKSVQAGFAFEIKAQTAEPVFQEDGAIDTEKTEQAQAENQAQAEEKMQNIKTLLQMLEQNELLKGVSLIDLAEENEAYFVYENRLKVLLGTFNNLEYKLATVAKLTKNETGQYLSASDKGTLDVSHQMEGEVIRIPFSPGPFSTEPVPEPTAEPQPTESPEGLLEDTQNPETENKQEEPAAS